MPYWYEGSTASTTTHRSEPPACQIRRIRIRFDSNNVIDDDNGVAMAAKSSNSAWTKRFSAAFNAIVMSTIQSSTIVSLMNGSLGCSLENIFCLKNSVLTLSECTAS